MFYKQNSICLHLTRILAGDLTPLTRATSSSISPTSTQTVVLLTLTSELLLLVASGESAPLTVLLLMGPDLTLYIDDAGILVIIGR